MVNSEYDGCNYVRLHLPAIYNGFKTDRPSFSEPRKTIDEIKQEIAGADVVVFHRAENRTYHNFAKVLKQKGKKIVMDNDDTFQVDGAHPLAHFQPNGTWEDDLKRRFDNLNEFISMCDLVTTSTQVLSDEYKKITSNVQILKNCVDPDDWDEPLRNDGDKIRIGMVGSVAFEFDYLHLKDLIRKLSKRDDVTFCMMGLGDKKHRENNPKVEKVFQEEYAFWDSVPKEHFPWCPVWLYPSTLNEMKLDIMLIPRKDNYFNRCKSNLKFLEAGMCEIPVIAQSFENGPYEEITDGVNGMLIKDNSEWEEKIEKLIQDKTLRRQMGKNAREYVLSNYSIKDHAHKWADAYSSLF